MICTKPNIQLQSILAAFIKQTTLYHGKEFAMFKQNDADGPCLKSYHRNLSLAMVEVEPGQT